MIRNAIFTALLVAGTVGASDAMAGTKSKQFICSANEVQECSPVEGCKRSSPGAINLPPMWHVDIANKKLAAITMEGTGRSEDIEGVKEADKELYLYGLQGEQSWSAVVSRETGAFTTTISVDGNGFVIFGVCAPK